MFSDNDTHTADRKHDPEDSITGKEHGGIDPSTIRNTNTTRVSGAESTSVIGSVVGSKPPGTGGGHLVSVDPSGDLATAILSRIVTALENERKAATAVDPAGDLTSQVAALVAKALKERGDVRKTGRGARSIMRSTTSVPSRTGRALQSGVELQALIPVLPRISRTLVSHPSSTEETPVTITGRPKCLPEKQ